MPLTNPESTAESSAPVGSAEVIPPASEEARITEDGEIRIYEDEITEILDR